MVEDVPSWRCGCLDWWTPHMRYMHVVDTRPPPPHQSTHALPGTIVHSDQ